MKFLGFYLGRHDSNVTLCDGDQVRYFKAERIFGIKHEFRSLKWVKQICRENEFVPDAVAYSDGDRNGLGQCSSKRLYKQMAPLWNVPTFCLDHYYAHILSAWPVVSMADVDIGIGIDGKGDHRMSRRTIRHPGNIEKARSVEHCTGKSVGRFFAKVGSAMKLRVGRLSTKTILTMDYAGKVMGAQAYGSKGKLPVSKAVALNRPYELLKYMPKPSFKNAKFLSWLATAHRLIGGGIGEHFERYCKKNDWIVYSGGVAQNTVYNNKLFKKFNNLYIPPHCYDGGMSLGCVEFLRLKYEQPEFSREGFPYWQQDVISDVVSSENIARVASLLAEGKIVGWMQGRGEIGPRALGNRSILLNPGIPNGKDILNRLVKHREKWRPYAPSVLWEHAREWFELDQPSPYMLRTVMVKKPELVPAITHVDGSSRVQTVHGGVFRELIEAFFKLTKIPMLLNTSFNGGGEPIYSTERQCMDLFERSGINVLCIGDRIHEKG